MGTEHLDENAVVEFIQGRMSGDTLHRAEEHVDGCEECRHLLADVSQMFRTEPMSLGQAVEEVTAPELGPGEPPPAGTLLAGRFRLQRVLGRGAMGQVYEAMDEQLHVPVAVKLLVPELRSEPSFLKDLHREIVVARKITHPNVCRVYDLGTDGSISFISMELVLGESLDRVLARRRLPKLEVAQILEQVCAALEAAHQEGVVHRDLKPSNIMLDGAGKVTVMDFGLARDLSGSASLRSGPIGTPAYWSPEQARGETVTLRSDLYAVGVICYEMFTGERLPHLPREDDALEEIPLPYRGPLRTCLQLKAERRYASAAALGAAFETARAALPERPRLKLRRRFVMALGIAVGFLAASLSLKLAERLRPAPATPRLIARPALLLDPPPSIARPPEPKPEPPRPEATHPPRPPKRRPSIPVFE